jgi:predicted AlkP superfamily phosphohydrolase/phosphomutase
MNNEKGNNDLENIIDSLTQRVKELEDINEGHRQLNAELRVELQMWKDMSSEHEKTKNLLHGYKKVIEDLSSQLRKAGK